MFRLHAQRTVTRVAAIAWLVIFIAGPPLPLLAHGPQMPGRNADPPRRAQRRPGTAGPARYWPVPCWSLVSGFTCSWPGRRALGLAPEPIAAQITAAWLTALALLPAAVATEATRCAAGPPAQACSPWPCFSWPPWRYPLTAYGAAAVTRIALLAVIGFLGAGAQAISAARRNKAARPAIEAPRPRVTTKDAVIRITQENR